MYRKQRTDASAPSRSSRPSRPARSTVRHPFRSTKRAAVGLVGAVAALFALPMDAYAAPSAGFFVSFSNQAYVTRGNVIWQAGGDQIGGSITAPSGHCARVVFDNNVAVQTRSVCSGTKNFGFTLPDFVDSPNDLFIDLEVREADGTFTLVNSDECFPGQAACFDHPI